MRIITFVLGFPYHLRIRPPCHQQGRERRRREEARSYECVRLAENVVEVFACEVERSPELLDQRVSALELGVHELLLSDSLLLSRQRVDELLDVVDSLEF